LLWFSDIYATGDNEILFAMDLEGQFKITNGINVSLTLSFLIDNHTVTDYSEAPFEEISYKENVFQMNLKPMLIIRPFSTGLKGFFIGFYPDVGVLHVENNEKNQFYTELGYGINWGYKWVFRNGFTMQVSSGIGKTFSIPKGSKEYISVNSDGKLSLGTSTDILILDFKLGYSF
jgi:hypothetical protein